MYTKALQKLPDIGVTAWPLIDCRGYTIINGSEGCSCILPTSSLVTESKLFQPDLHVASATIARLPKGHSRGATRSSAFGSDLRTLTRRSTLRLRRPGCKGRNDDHRIVSMSEHSDYQRRVLVVGSGPAGIAAATHLVAYGIRFEWVSRDETIGGLAATVSHEIVDLPFGVPLNGGALMAEFQRRVDGLGVRPQLRTEVVHIRYNLQDNSPLADPIEVSFLRDGRATSRRYRSIVLCTGTVPRHIAGVTPKVGWSDILQVSVPSNAVTCTSQSVVVVGCGDEAMMSAIELSRYCRVVHVVHRRGVTTGQARLLGALKQMKNVTFHAKRELVHVDPGVASSSQILLSDGTKLDCDALFVRIGSAPNLPAVVAVLNGGSEEAVAISALTSYPGVFIAGDVIAPRDRHTILNAMGDGAGAARRVMQFIGADGQERSIL